MSTMPVPKFVNVSEAAELLGCSVGRIRQRLIAKELKGVKANARAWLILRAEIDRELRRRKPGGENGK
jgi:excisionase family DNA binding protein